MFDVVLLVSSGVNCELVYARERRSVFLESLTCSKQNSTDCLVLVAWTLVVWFLFILCSFQVNAMVIFDPYTQFVNFRTSSGRRFIVVGQSTL